MIVLGKRKPARALKLWESFQPLVKLYNLHIDFNSCVGVFPPRPPKDADREKIVDYLRQHAPHVFSKAPAQMFVMDKKAGKTLCYGTLENFRQSEGRDWLISEYAAMLCWFFYRLCFLLDVYIEGKFTGKHLDLLAALLREFQPTFMLRERNSGGLFEVSWNAPIDVKRFEIMWGGGVVSTEGILDKYRLNIGDLLARLTFSLYKIIAYGVHVLRCQRRGCLDIFIPKPRAPTGAKAPKYCPRCRSRRKK